MTRHVGSRFYVPENVAAVEQEKSNGWKYGLGVIALGAGLFVAGDSSELRMALAENISNLKGVANLIELGGVAFMMLGTWITARSVGRK